MSEDTNATGTAAPELPERMSVRDAGLAFESLLPAQADKSEDGEAEDGPETEREQDQARLRQALKRAGKETDSEGDESEESEESEQEDAEEKDEEAEEKSEEEGARKRSPQDPEFTLHVEGKDTPVRLSELKNGYLRQSDYTRKTQEVANQRKSLEQELDQARQERTEYGDLLPQLRKALESEVGQEPNWDALLKADPQKYLLEQRRWDNHQKQLSSVKAEEQRVNQQRQVDFQRQQQAFVAEQKAKLLETEPEFRAEKTAKVRAKAISDLMKSVGFGPNELAVFDHRAMRVLNKAAKYDELMAQSKGLRKQMRSAPVVTPDGGTRAPRSANQNARSRLNSTGKVMDAAAVFEGLL